MANHPCDGCKFNNLCGDKKLACKDFFNYCELEPGGKYVPTPEDQRDPCKYYYAISFPNDMEDFETMKLRMTDYDIWRRSNLFNAPVHPDLNASRKTRNWFKNVVLANNDSF